MDSCYAASSLNQGCQMVGFKPKKSKFEYITEDLEMENVGIFYAHLKYFTVIWYILRSFGLLCGHLVCFKEKNLATLLWTFAKASEINAFLLLRGSEKCFNKHEVEGVPRLDADIRISDIQNVEMFNKIWSTDSSLSTYVRIMLCRLVKFYIFVVCNWDVGNFDSRQFWYRWWNVVSKWEASVLSTNNGLRVDLVNKFGH
jgi:hypothetical protein